MPSLKYLNFLLLISMMYSVNSLATDSLTTDYSLDTDLLTTDSLATDSLATNTSTISELFRNEKYTMQHVMLTGYVNSVTLFFIVLPLILLCNVLTYKLYIKKKILTKPLDTHSITISTI